MRILLLLALLLVACGATVPATPEESALALTFNDGSCGGTAVGPHSILTAAHCFEPKSTLVRVNGLPAKEIAPRVSDGNEHVIAVVDIEFTRWARVASKPAAGTRVRVLGHPYALPTMYRDGTVSGDTLKTPCFYLPQTTCLVTLVDINTASGDSGSALFNADGDVVGVITGTSVLEGWMMRVVLPLRFTQAQLAQIQ